MQGNVCWGPCNFDQHHQGISTLVLLIHWNDSLKISSCLHFKILWSVVDQSSLVDIVLEVLDESITHYIDAAKVEKFGGVTRYGQCWQNVSCEPTLEPWVVFHLFNVWFMFLFNFWLESTTNRLSFVLQDPELESGLLLERVSIDDILEAQRVQQEQAEEERNRKARILKEKGLPFAEQREDIYSWNFHPIIT